MRATRHRLRRRRHLRRKRAARLTPGPQTTSQDNVPELGPKLAYTGHHDGLAERWPDPAVQQSRAGDLALRGYEAERRRDLECSMVQTATPHEANPVSVLQTVPGLGTIRSRVRLEAMHASARCPRVQAFVS